MSEMPAAYKTLDGSYAEFRGVVVEFDADGDGEYYIADEFEVVRG